MIQFLHKMGELNVRFHIFPALLDRLLGYLPVLAGYGEALPYRFPHRRCGPFGELIDIAISQGTVSGGDRWLNAPSRLKPREAFAFAGAVNSDQRLEKIAISDALRGFAFAANRQRHFERPADCLYVLRTNPLQN